MKYLQHFKIFEKFIEKTLYHGGLEGFYDEETDENFFKKFKTFAPRTAYFSDNPKFAVDYADRKSSEGGYDADRLLYTCKFKGNLFEYDNPEDMNKLIPLIPKEVEVSHGTMWFMTAKIPKEEIIKNLQGIETIKPKEQFVNAKIDDRVPNPIYSGENFIIVDRDSENVYSISERTYQYYLKGSSLGYDKHFSHYTKYKDIFEDWRKAIIDTYNKNKGTNYSYPKYSDGFEYFYNTYSSSKTKWNIDFVARNRFQRGNDMPAFTEEDHKNIDNLYSKALEEFKKIAYKELDRKEWVINNTDIKMDSNWTYYENEDIQHLIKKLGYDGYKALEDKHRTYAIYQPDKTIEIVEVINI